jgi:hypothetical protein
VAVAVDVSGSKTAKLTIAGQSLVVTAPDNIAAGDLLIGICCTDGAETISLSGWTAFDTGKGATHTTRAFWKVATSADESAADYTFTWTTNEIAVGILMRLTGADTTTVPHIYTTNVDAAQQVDFLSVNTTVDRCVVLYMGGNDHLDFNAANFPPSGLTVIQEDEEAVAGGCACWASYKFMQSSGASGAYNFNLDNSEAWSTWTIAIATAPQVPDVDAATIPMNAKRVTAVTAGKTPDVKMAVVRGLTPTSTGNQSYTNSDLGGKTPKAAIIFGTYADTDGTLETHLIGCLGVATSAGSEWGLTFWSEDNAGTAESYWTSFNRCCTLSTPGFSSTQIRATVNAWIANGVQLNFSAADSHQCYITIVLFAGDDVYADSGIYDDLGTSEGATAEVTGKDFWPDIFLAAVLTATNSDNRTNDIICGWSLAGHDPDLAHALYAFDIFEQQGADSMDVRATVSDDKVADRYLYDGARDFTLALKYLQYGAFKVEVENGSAASERLGWMMIGVGGTARAGVYQKNAPTATGNWTSTDPGWQPAGVMMFTHFLDTFGTSQTSGDQGAFGVSMFTGNSDKFSNVGLIEDAQDTSDTASLCDDVAVNLKKADQGTGWLTSSVTITSTGFTLNFSSVPASAPAAKWFFFAIEDVSAGGEAKSATANISAVSTLSAVALRGQFATANISAVSSLTAIPQRGRSSTANISALSSLSAIGQKRTQKTATANTVIISVFTIAQWLRGRSATANISAVSTLSAIPEKTTHYTATANISAVSSLSAIGVKGADKTATANIVCTSSLSAVGLRGKEATANITALSSLSAVALRGKEATANVAAVSSLSAVALRGLEATANISALSSLSAVALRGKEATANIAIVSALTAVGEKAGTKTATANIAAVSALSAVGLRGLEATANISAVSSLTAIPEKRTPKTATANITCVSSLSADSQKNHAYKPTANITAISSLSAVPLRGRSATANISIVSSLSAIGVKGAEKTATANVVAVSSLTVVGLRGLEATAAINIVSALVADPAHGITVSAEIAAICQLTAVPQKTTHHMPTADIDIVSTLSAAVEHVLYSTIDGAANVTLSTQYDTLRVVSDGQHWWRVDQ